MEFSAKMGIRQRETHVACAILRIKSVFNSGRVWAIWWEREGHIQSTKELWG